MRKLYKLNFNCGRHGALSGLFIAEEEDVKAAISKNVYFGEVLGKHSEIYGTLRENEVILVTEDQEFIEKFEKYIGKSSGYNPLDYLMEEKS